MSSRQVDFDSATEMPEFVGIVLEELRCEVCCEIAVNAKQTNCGHRVCGACVDQRFDSGQTKVDCPMVGTEQENGDCVRDGWIKDKILPDNFAKKQVLKIRVYCSNKRFGCHETPIFAELSEHAAVCPKRRVMCPNCNFTCALHEVQKHLEKECPHRPGPCRYGCQFTGSTIEEMADHCSNAVAVKQHLRHMQQECVDVADKLDEANTERASLSVIRDDLQKQHQGNILHVNDTLPVAEQVQDATLE